MIETITTVIFYEIMLIEVVGVIVIVAYYINLFKGIR
jgi:hypothetical protein